MPLDIKNLTNGPLTAGGRISWTRKEGSNYIHTNKRSLGFTKLPYLSEARKGIYKARIHTHKTNNNKITKWSGVNLTK